MDKIKTHTDGTKYVKIINGLPADPEITQVEKDELDTLLTTHQGSCVDLSTVTTYAISDTNGARKFFINYVKTDASKSVFNVDL